MMLAKIYITLKDGILDPPGKTVQQALTSLGYANVEDVRIGKYVLVRFKNGERTDLEDQTRQMCEKLLANPVIESFSFEIVENPEREK
ncbi:phosphoribosylformylglycinamidine synthase subunit PurS [candidate division KSB1 bacterium]|nr:phosphoribosylformylglycinamidine synthase subunit PurS [candidate division KSB1 bacterium]